jgi:UDP-N-acetylglucosamine/UDP-N-acetylgalactosamine 4-epimerase
MGLRYFNVFGARQDPEGAYAAVIPKWASALLNAQPVFINGDGETSRDFCYVANAVQANIRAALMPSLPSSHEVFNVAVGERTSLNQLFEMIRRSLADLGHPVGNVAPRYQDFRAGDVRHSLADISKAKQHLGYEPEFSLAQGLGLAMPWYLAGAAAQ